MPKSTFFNLPDEKKERITEAAYGQFTDNKYENVTVSGIADSAQIPVGSFYQYFCDKDDLYLYLFFEIGIRVMRICLETGKTYPELNGDELWDQFTERELAFYDTWYNVPDNVMRKFYFGEYDDRLFEYCRNDLEAFKSEGRLVDYDDMEFILYWYVTSTFNLYMYCKKHHIEEEKERLKLKKFFFDQILANGILKKPEEAAASCSTPNDNKMNGNTLDYL